ncbi:MAG: hypothetical protein HQL77_18715, partial [Magnetococcales bacterium]|nr:hypothetical protein [Magnetococcales bacterium]
CEDIVSPYLSFLPPTSHHPKLPHLLQKLDPVWEELFPIQQNRLLSLLVDKLVVESGSVDLQLKVNGLGALVDELSSSPKGN